MRKMEGVISWKRLCIILISLVIVQSLFLFSTSFKDGKYPGAPVFPPAQHYIHSSPDSQIVDTLTEQQCADQFSDIYYNIRKSAKHWKDTKHNITADDVNASSWRADGVARVLIHENELRILETKGTYGNDGYRLRTLSSLSLLQRAIRSATAGGERLPTVEAALVVDDKSLIPGGADTHTAWTFASHSGEEHKKHWLLPDFGFYYAGNTGSWTEARRRAAENDAPFIDKIPKAVWRGVTWTNEYIREGLVAATEDHEELYDVKVIDWASKSNLMPMEFMCKYAMTIHTEGRSYSGRLGYLLNCDSLPLIHDLSWTGHFYNLLVPSGPNQNYVKVKNDWSDLEEKVKWYLNHPDVAQRIINNSLATFRNAHTTEAATSCYLRRLIKEYSTAAFTPEVMREKVEGEVPKRRGISFAEFVQLREDYREEEG